MLVSMPQLLYFLRDHRLLEKFINKISPFHSILETFSAELSLFTNLFKQL